MRKFKEPAQHGDYFVNSWGRATFPEPKKLTTVHKCPRCGRFCKVEFIQEYEWSVRVSACCKARDIKVLRYAHKS